MKAKIKNYFNSIKWGVGIAFFFNTCFAILLLIFDFELKTNSSFPALWFIYFLVANGVTIYHITKNDGEIKKRQQAEGLLFRELELATHSKEYIERLESDRRLYMESKNETILKLNRLAKENEKLLLNVKDLEKEILELKEIPSSKGIEFIAEEPEVPHIHVSDFHIGQEVECVDLQPIPDEKEFDFMGKDGIKIGDRDKVQAIDSFFLTLEGHENWHLKSNFRPVTKEAEK